MNKKQKELLKLLLDTIEELKRDNCNDVVERMEDVCKALIDGNSVLAVIIAEIHEVPKDLINEISETFKVMKVA